MLTNGCRAGRASTRSPAQSARRDDDGQDLIEYALLTGIIAIAGILVFPTIQAKMADAYQDWNDNAQAIWEPHRRCRSDRARRVGIGGAGPCRDLGDRSMNVAQMICLGLAVVACGWDLRTRRIPQLLTLGGALAGLIVPSGQSAGGTQVSPAPPDGRSASRFSSCRLRSAVSAPGTSSCSAPSAPGWVR